MSCADSASSVCPRFLGLPFRALGTNDASATRPIDRTDSRRRFNVLADTVEAAGVGDGRSTFGNSSARIPLRSTRAGMEWVGGRGGRDVHILMLSAAAQPSSNQAASSPSSSSSALLDLGAVCWGRHTRTPSMYFLRGSFLLACPTCPNSEEAPIDRTPRFNL